MKIKKIKCHNEKNKERGPRGPRVESKNCN
jgi:hypothetical protein